MSSKHHYLFGNNNDWQYPNEHYLNYVTPLSVSQILVNEANQLFNLSDKIIWDMFAGIGTDAVRFAPVSGKIICSEIDNETYQCLNVNMELFNINNISTYNENCCNANHKVDIIYYDPPWGQHYISGNDFDFDNVLLTPEITVTDLLTKLYQNHNIIVKAPYLCNTLDKVFHKEDILRILTFSQQKIKFYMVRSKS